MNIFYLDEDPKIAAEHHCDKHVVKMIVESAQLLSTARLICDGNTNRNSFLYKITHRNHPCSLWVRDNVKHYIWLYKLFRYLSYEYEKRYNKIHLSWKKYSYKLKMRPVNIPSKPFIQPPQCMPDFCKRIDSVEAYRNYYKIEKSKFATWKIRTPYWWNK